MPSIEVHQAVSTMTTIYWALLGTINETIREDIVIIEDFNYTHIDWINHIADTHRSVSAKKCLNYLQDNLLTQPITFPTRARGSDAPSTLDLVITNNHFIDNISNLSPLGKSDHSVLQVECNWAYKRDQKCKLNFNKGDYDSLRNYIQQEFQSAKMNDVINCNDCVEDQWQLFKNSLNVGIKK